MVSVIFGVAVLIKNKYMFEGIKGFQKGHLVSKEMREKMSISKMGNKNPMKRTDVANRARLSKLGKATWNKGKKCPQLSGENNSRWKGGRKESEKRWKNKNRDKVNFWRKRHEIKRRKAVGVHTFGEWENLKAQYNWICPCCKKSEPEIKLTEDHIIPLMKGGSDNIENIQPLCMKCNQSKYLKIIKY
jgi:5-methylcytosine-specific restriction endonuclease McrA